MKQYHRTWAEIDLDAIRSNMSAFRENVPQTAMLCAVVKTDGYGLGAVPTAKAVEDMVWGYAVATADEGCNLRAHGIKKPILVLGYVHPDTFPDMIAHELRYACYQQEMLEQLRQTAARMQKTAYIHVKTDTGMSRIGLRPEEAAAFLQQIQGDPYICAEGLFTHLATADMIENQPAMEQQRRFAELMQELKEKNLCPPLCHCANSAAAIWMTDAPTQMFRVGISLYGYYPSDEVPTELVSLKPAMQLKSEIAHVKTVPAGTAVGYGGTYLTDRETVIATVPIGYGDGYSRALSNKGSMLVHGKRVPIIGRVCMDQTMLDVTEVCGVKPGDTVTVIGRDGSEEITVEETAALSGSFNYELLCDLGKRIPRVYYRNGRVVGTKDYAEDLYQDFMSEGCQD